MASVSKKVGKGTTKGKAATKSAGTIENPYREGGAYHAVVESLRKLGMGKMHDQSALLKTFPTAMGAAWKEFKAKDARNENGKDTEGRIIQNALVVNRPDYGLPLRRCGVEVRKERTDKGYSFGLFKLGASDVKAAEKMVIVRKPKAVVPVAKTTTKGKGAKVEPKGKGKPKVVKTTTKTATAQAMKRVA
jgi:hypothetical protein